MDNIEKNSIFDNKKNKLFLVIFSVIGIIIVVILANRFLIDKNDDVKNENNSISVSSVISSGTQTNNEGAVTVKVTPNLSDWSFEVTLDTHSVSINKDLTKVSILIDENKNEYMPIIWDGDSSDGHHRTGILRFGKIIPIPKSVTLVIRQIGDIAERKFLWTINP
ncbi:MAG: hypothetical protein AAB334_01690 [Patescibacteria group bacterium]